MSETGVAWQSLNDYVRPPWDRRQYIVPACGPAFGRLWLGSSTELLCAAKDAACDEKDLERAAAIRDFTDRLIRGSEP